MKTRQPPPKTKAPSSVPSASLTWLRPALGLVLVLILAASGWYWHQYTRPGVSHDRAAKEALAAQRPADAEQEWLQGIKEDPTSPVCFNHLGDLYMAQKRYPDAVVQYTAASRLSPQDGDLFLKLTRAQLAVGEKRAAAGAAKRAAELRPDDADAWGLYGLITEQLFDTSASLPALRRAHALRPSDRDYLIELVRTEANNIDLSQAERDLTPFLQAHPDDPMANHLMAYLYEQKPRTPEVLQAALAYELKAAAGMPGDLRVCIGLGDLYLDMGRNADALRTFQEGLKSNPRSEEMMHGLVTSYTRLGQPQQAASIAARLQSLTTLHQRITHLQEVMKGDPANIAAGLELGRLQEQDGDDAAAHALYVSLVRRLPQDPRPRRALADFFLRHGSPRLARQALNTAHLP